MATTIKQRTSNNNPKGFDQLGFVLFPDCTSEVEIPFINNRFITGFENNLEKKKYFEDRLGVRFDTEQGQEFLDNYRIRFNHEINIKGSSPFDEFDLWLIKANNGFGLIKIGEEESPTEDTIFVFFDEEKEMIESVTRKSIVNRAAREIEDLWDGNRAKLVLIAKYLFEVNSGISSELIAYNKLTDFISLDKPVRNAENAQIVLRAFKADPDYMDTTVDTKTAIAKNIIRFSDGWYVNHITQTKLGRNIEDTITFLNNPQNQDEFGTGGAEDSVHTIKAQLKNSLR